MKIGFVGGGTGGHFYPLMAVAEELNTREEKPDLYYFGPSPYNNELLEKFGIRHVYCPAGKLRLYFSVQNVLDIFRNFFGVFIAIYKLYIIYPDVIFSKGGYTSIPILAGARFLNIPIVIHESDAVPGRANKLAIKKARYIGIAYDNVARFFPSEKTALVGIPLLNDIKQAPANPHELLGIPNDKPLIYVTGGSSGATRINNLILTSLDQLLPRYRIFHQAGMANLDEMKLVAQGLIEDKSLLDNYYLEGNIGANTIASLLTASSLVITRAGSTTLFEIACHGKPSIVIPIPEDISRDQRTNAYAYAETGGATVIEEHNLSKNLLTQEIDSIINDSARQAKMSQAARGMFLDGASEKIASILISIGIEHGS
ncbi:MAG: UDP-N-acetylglucosamine--N-acetylmuramyl-(pentapeptide) pyrophosphoryl-undecaprenol N-acetylglucosamine transferase [Candidatus Nomurabacteria bacterium]|nr:MAG: UDP-N-acetylglucosamine--N-acetylmuramyl-(pentapeptide) pyrophosphoryl-undecaprenol N-acetylglucosamine transferase [Candidatus Nomurabacteria bacterium]